MIIAKLQELLADYNSSDEVIMEVNHCFFPVDSIKIDTARLNRQNLFDGQRTVEGDRLVLQTWE